MRSDRIHKALVNFQNRFMLTEPYTSATVQAKVWIENREYADEKTLSALRPADEL